MLASALIVFTARVIAPEIVLPSASSGLSGYVKVVIYPSKISLSSELDVESGSALTLVVKAVVSGLSDVDCVYICDSEDVSVVVPAVTDVAVLLNIMKNKPSCDESENSKSGPKGFHCGLCGVNLFLVCPLDEAMFTEARNNFNEASEWSIFVYLRYYRKF